RAARPQPPVPPSATPLPTAQLGERVRLTLARPQGRPLIGTLERYDRDTLGVRLADGALTLVSAADVVGIEGSARRIDRAAEFVKTSSTGMTIGALVGGGMVVILGGWRAVAGPDDGTRQIAILLVMAGGIVGGVMGAVGGAASTIGLESDEWVQLATPLPDDAPAVRNPTATAAPRPGLLDPLPLGTRIRVQFASTRPALVGRLLGQDDSLRVRVDDGPETSIAWPLVRQIDRSRGAPAFVRHSLAPVGIGAAIGALAVPRVVSGLGDSCAVPGTCAERANATITGAVLGGAAGLIFAETRRAERWEPVPMHSPAP
nr:hypothetical protein [Gemmatimonadaceae bacterium]